MPTIDLNSDLGEGCPHDRDILALITSANVACGGHAGDPSIALATLRAARELGVRVGAHPGFPDREHFGRRELERSEKEIYHDCLYQVGFLVGLAATQGLKLSHLKPHGALYNLACKNEAQARPIVAAAELFELPIMALPGSRLEELSRGRCPFIAEGFADRRYLPDGSLVPRSRPDAFVEEPDEAVRQAQWLIADRGVRTLCVHGDNPRALEFVRALRQALERGGFSIRPFA